MKSKTKDTYKTGILAEALAIFLLYIKCYRIITRRYKTKVGEIDIIASRGKTLVFVEVKKRSNKNNLFESITAKQQLRISNAAELFLIKHPHFHRHKKRFDAILIPSNLLPIHIKNAWNKR